MACSGVDFEGVGDIATMIDPLKKLKLVVATPRADVLDAHLLGRLIVTGALLDAAELIHRTGAGIAVFLCHPLAGGMQRLLTALTKLGDRVRLPRLNMLTDHSRG